ncbi:hypothetical protein AMES_3532 [Amycolatopsis mediterranei S699]|uniref:Uncharacterized protein n=2 Tax=Amycolatopsis mediterranei TaxID=33910 RepID=A0A0H3D525_AMYMU|nr:CHAT domain-containing protein [Amycolatopsis mediterranei]ADJ45357.1 conserved hypothetical protein [Amycolatopsis mediterranei U32]AEK42117.1 hypothetical protein RAM_18155 [Amycolatopsis mediterranei S699]AFO77068.1 hypothetical protein AMES_3532 [Amycolatopsis mediterranei S699]AGT84196.1 hypothetical protein B737_3532 [Amycolatopsis mediterranei RB]KDO08473.1 hypothetical protein DV26_23235 [Amycolatopsis mediterranei]
MSTETVEFNGIDADTGQYLFPAQSPGDVAAAARAQDLASPFLQAMRYRKIREEKTFGVASLVDDPDDLAQAGWGLVVAHDANPRVRDALRPLLDLRQSQAGPYYREMTVHPGEDASRFLLRHGMGPDPADPRKVPYYLLIVGSPAAIPYSFQYRLDVVYAVGRVEFESLEEYSAYARFVTAAEDRPKASARVHLFGTSNPGDRPTKLSATRLVEPLARELVELAPACRVTRDVGERATKRRLSELMADGPELLFTATHGLGRRTGDAHDVQGALVCQDWPGPLTAGPVSPEQYFSGADVVAPLAPRVVFSFACYSAGGPGNPGMARLPQQLLGHGVLAFIGHIDRAWGYSFLWTGAEAQITSMVSTVLAIQKGRRLGYAMEAMGSRWAVIATELTQKLGGLRDRRIVDDRQLAWLWTASNDARDYVLIGDPAVRAR